MEYYILGAVLAIIFWIMLGPILYRLRIHRRRKFLRRMRHRYGVEFTERQFFGDELEPPGGSDGTPDRP